MECLLIILLLCTCKNASSLSFTATPDRVVVGDSGTVTMACSVTESDVSQVYDLILLRAVTPGSTTEERIASFDSGTATLGDWITDDKGFAVTGNLNGASSRLEVSMDKSKMTCSDARLYTCKLAYESSTTNNIETVGSNLTLHVLVLPQMLPPLQAKRNGNFTEGGTQSDRATFEAGDQLELQCKANIGSVDSATIRWRKTSEMDSGQLINYHPPEGTYDKAWETTRPTQVPDTTQLTTADERIQSTTVAGISCACAFFGNVVGNVIRSVVAILTVFVVTI